MDNFVRAINYTVGADLWENCTYHNGTQSQLPGYTCVTDYDNKTVAGFTAAPGLSVPTAPAFAFYAMTLVLTVLLLPGELIHSKQTSNRQSASTQSRRTLPGSFFHYSLLAIHATVPGAHIIAAACTTAAAMRVRNYLQSTPEIAGLVWGASLGSALLQVIWLGFLATALGSICDGLRWWLKRRWREILEWETVLTLANFRYRSNQGRQVAQTAVEARSSLHASIRTQLPKYEETNPAGENPEEGVAPRYEDVNATIANANARGPSSTF